MIKVILTLIWTIYLSTSSAKVLVISDIDDTIKKANSTNSVSEIYYFLKAEPYEEMAGLYRELSEFYSAQGEEIEFIYLSAAYDATFNQDKWLSKHGFPKGRAILRKLGDGKTYEYKYGHLKNILSKQDVNQLELFLFGDNSAQDPRVYKDIVDELKIPVPYIFIRDVSTYATFWQAGWEVKKIPGIFYYFSEMELRNSSHFFFLSDELTASIEQKYQKQDLIPTYTFETLKKRIENHECPLEGFQDCDDLSEKWALHLWWDYYQRM